MIIALLLAAGEAKRMGRNKLLLPLGEKPVVVRTLENLATSRVDEIIVVTGYQAALIEKELLPLMKSNPGRIKTVYNEEYQRGMSTSIKVGTEVVKERADAFLIMLADQPLIGAELVDKIIDKFDPKSAKICLPVYKGQPGHPVLFPRKYLSEMAALSGDVGARGIVEAHPEEVEGIEVDSEEILVDIDKREEYEAVLAKN